jgi:hypothetical protein
VRTAVLQQLDELCAMSPDAMREQRYQRFRAMAVRNGGLTAAGLRLYQLHNQSS